MSFPVTIDSPDTSMQGTSLFTGDDHSLQHRTVAQGLINTETFLGTNSASNVFGGFTSGMVAVPINSGTLGTAISNGTINGLTAGSPAITGGTFTNPTITGGTANGITIGSTSILKPLNSAFWVNPGTNNQVLGTNQTTQMTWGTPQYDLLGEIGTTNSFIAKQAGLYQFTCAFMVEGANSTGQLNMIRLNGTTQQQVDINPDTLSKWNFWQGSVMAGGTVDVAIENTSSTTPGTINNGNGQISFYGKRVF